MNRLREKRNYFYLAAYLALLIALVYLGAFKNPAYVRAATQTYTVPLETPGKMATLLEDLTYYEDTWTIYLARHDNGLFSGIVFDGVAIGQGSIINQANLTIYYPSGVDFDTDNVTATIRGYDADDISTLNQGLLKNGPVTTAEYYLNCSQFTTQGHYTIEITAVIQEIINRHGWEPGNNLGLIIWTARQVEWKNRSIPYFYEAAGNYGSFKNRRPTLSIRYGEAPAGPVTGDYEYNGTYRGYDIYKGAEGTRLVLFEDASGQDWVNCYNNISGVWTQYNYSLPFNVDLDPDVQDTGIVIGHDLYVCGDSGTNVSLYRSPDFGASWEYLHSWTVSNTIEAWTMSFNPDTYSLHVFSYDETALRCFYFSYNVSSDSTIQAPLTIFDGANVGPYDIAMATDENDNVWLAATIAGSWGSEVRLWTDQRISGAWAGNRIFDASDGADQWTWVDIQYAQDVPNNDYPVVFIVSTADDIYADRKTKTEALGNLHFDKGEWPAGVQSLGRDGSVNTIFNSVLWVWPDAIDPYDEYFSIYLAYKDTKGGNLDIVGTAATWPYFSSGYYDNANYSSNMHYTAIYWDWTGPRVYSQDINDKGTLFEMGLGWLERPGTFIYTQGAWNAKKKIIHHEDIDYYTVASYPFGDPVWLIYDNGSLVDTLPLEEYNITDITDLIDDTLGFDNETDPYDPGAGSIWTGEEYPFLGRLAFKRYFILAGLFMVVAPWVYISITKDIGFIPMLIVLNAAGIGLLLGVFQI